MLEKWTAFVLKNSTLIVVFGTLLSLIGLFYSVKLYRNLRTDMEELLPRDARSVKDSSEVARRISSTDSLAILIFSSQIDNGRKFQEDLARKLEDLPSPYKGDVEYKINRELDFF